MLPDRGDWLGRKLDLILMGWAMLSKSLIQFSVVWQGCVPISHCHTQCPQPCSRLLPSHASARILDTHRQVWVSFLWGHCSFLLGPGVHKVLFVPSKSLFPQSCVSSVIKSHWPPKSNSLGVLRTLPDPQVGKSVVGPRTFLIVWEFLWYNCSAVCGLSAWLGLWWG